MCPFKRIRGKHLFQHVFCRYVRLRRDVPDPLCRGPSSDWRPGVRRFGNADPLEIASAEIVRRGLCFPTLPSTLIAPDPGMIRRKGRGVGWRMDRKRTKRVVVMGCSLAMDRCGRAPTEEDAEQHEAYVERLRTDHLHIGDTPDGAWGLYSPRARSKAAGRFLTLFAVRYDLAERPSESPRAELAHDGQHFTCCSFVRWMSARHPSTLADWDLTIQNLHKTSQVSMPMARARLSRLFKRP